MSTCTLEVQGHDAVAFDLQPDETVLDGILRSGWEIPFSCRSGVCEACRATVKCGQVAPGAKPDGTALLCRTRACGDITVVPARLERATPSEHKRFKAKVYRISHALDDVAVVDLRFPAGTKMRFKPGQHLQVHLDGQSKPRSFSMANAPGSADSVQLHVRVLPNSVFGSQILPTLQPGALLEIELPFGNFYLREGEAPVILVAGGTGFAPIQSILDAHLAKNPQRTFTLYWGARTAAELYARAKVEKWTRLHPNFRFVGVVSREEVVAPLRQGRVHDAVLHDFTDLSGHQVFVCGAPELVTSARDAFVGSRGLLPASFFCDGFAIAGT